MLITSPITIRGRVTTTKYALNMNMTRHDQLILFLSLLLLMIRDKVVAKCLSVLVVISLLELIAFAMISAIEISSPAKT